jgi:hypothetical protein
MNAVTKNIKTPSTMWGKPIINNSPNHYINRGYKPVPYGGFMALFQPSTFTSHQYYVTPFMECIPWK